MTLNDYLWAGAFVVAIAVAMVLPADAILHAQERALYALPITHTVTLTAVSVDAAEFQTPLPCAAVTWATSDANRATIAAVTEMPGSATLTPVSTGAVTVTATCGPLTQTLAVQIVGQAVALRIGVGEPVAK